MITCPNSECGKAFFAVEKWVLCPHCQTLVHLKINKRGRIKKITGHNPIDAQETFGIFPEDVPRGVIPVLLKFDF